MRSHVVVTGAGSGLGAVIADELTARGRLVILVDRDALAAAGTSSELAARHGVDVPVVVGDLSTIEGIDAVARAARAR